MMKRFVSSVLLAAALLIAPRAEAGWGEWWSSLTSAGRNATLNQAPAAGQVKELLKLLVDQSVGQLGRAGGYAKNAAVQVDLPDKLKSFEGFLRKAGLGTELDALRLEMNRAAEKAAPKAKEVFVESLSNLSVADAEAIFKGGPTAATDFLAQTSRADLQKLYEPIVRQKMKETSVVQMYEGLQAQLRKLPMMSGMTLPALEPYVVNQSLDGIFRVMSEKEKALRENPTQVASAALQKVLLKYAPAEG